MAFEGLTEKLQNALKKLSGRGKLSEADVKVAMRESASWRCWKRTSTIKVAKDFVKKVTERARRRGCAGKPDSVRSRSSKSSTKS